MSKSDRAAFQEQSWEPAFLATYVQGVQAYGMGFLVPTRVSSVLAVRKEATLSASGRVDSAKQPGGTVRGTGTKREAEMDSIHCTG